MKKLIKHLPYMIIIQFLLAILLCNISFGVNIDPIFQDIEAPSEADSVKDIMNKALGVVQMIAIGIATIMLIVLAIKYMTSAPNEKAEIKKHAVPYIIGAILMFASSAVVEIIKQFAFTNIN